MDKPTKPINLIPRSFGGVKNNFSASLQSSGYEDGVPAIYGGDNLNYQLDATGKELDYCEKICDYINAIPINKTPIVDANNKLVYTQYDIRVYSASETYYVGDYVTGVVNGVKHIYQSLKNNNIGQSLSNETYWKKVDIISDIKTIGRNIGEIVASTIPLTDAGLHLLDGALLQYGSYQAFIDYIADLYESSDYTAIFTTESAWQTSVSTYGVCGKFVYDSANNTVRLPKYSNKIYTSDIESNAPVVGNGMALGVTDGTSNYGMYIGQNSTEASLDYSTAFYGSNVGVSGSIYTGTNSAIAGGVTTDGTKSGIIADLANITTSLEGYYYIVIATSTKTDIEVDIDEIATDLNGKADVDLTNTSPAISFATSMDNVGIRTVVETYQNGARWYRVWSDGWCEQGGETAISTGGAEITFLKAYINTNYTALAVQLLDADDTGGVSTASSISGTTSYSFGKKTTGLRISQASGTVYKSQWMTCGYIS